MSETTELTVFEPIDKEEVKTRIYEVRGFRVMLDKDIAGYFGVTTGNLNKAKNRNNDRFPEHFCFTLTDQELSLFQSGIAMQTKGVKGGRSTLIPHRRLPERCREKVLCRVSDGGRGVAGRTTE